MYSKIDEMDPTVTRSMRISSEIMVRSKEILNEFRQDLVGKDGKPIERFEA